MKKLILLALLPVVCGNPVVAVENNDRYITIAVIDTGLRKDIVEQGYSKGICKIGHKDFTGTGINDDHGHGTNISGLIHKYAKGLKYCQVIIKFWVKSAGSRENMI